MRHQLRLVATITCSLTAIVAFTPPAAARINAEELPSAEVQVDRVVAAVLAVQQAQDPVQAARIADSIGDLGSIKPPLPEYLGSPAHDAVIEAIAPGKAPLPQEDQPAGDAAPLGPGTCNGNLVPNGDFETVGTCPNTIGQVSFAPPWFLPTPGSADFFHACAGSGPATAGVPTNFYGTQAAHSGNGVMGLRVYGNVPPNTTTDYREYIEVPLSASLVAGQTYTLSFWLSLCEASSVYATKEVNAYFSAGPIYSNLGTQLNFTPQWINPGPPVTNTTGWTQVSATFVAAGGENHMTIGNFKTDAATPAIVAGGGCCPVTYYYVDDVCLTGPAGTLNGACCYQGAAGPICQVLTAAQCAALNGIFGGKGTNCNGVQCNNVWGACCIPAPGPKVCVIKTPNQCAAIGGMYLGNFTACTPGDPCNPPTGACCYQIPGSPNFTCVITTQANCTSQYNGIYKGNNSSCFPDPCNPTGACCYSKAGFPNNFCVVTTQAACVNQFNGTYLGNNSVCPSNNCNPLPAKGACCYQIAGTTYFACTTTTAAGCATLFNSTYYGDGSSCAIVGCATPMTGACCYFHPDGTGPFCIVTDSQTCIAVLHGTFQGIGTPCNPDTCIPPPPTGACCYEDPLTATWFCTVTTQIDCLQNYPNSTYMGNGTPCNPNPCAPNYTGACCYLLPDGTPGGCVVTNPADCLNVYHGTYMGNSTTCTPNPCLPTGACCYQTAVGPVCIVTTAADCASIYNGQYQGNNVPCTNPSPCAPTGACCYNVPPICTITTQQNCINVLMGTWFGPNSTCQPNPCLPTGACCYQGAAGPQCIVVNQQDCINIYHGVWQARNVSCTPNPCIPTGACCYQQSDTSPYTCIITTQQICATLANSIWQGPNTTCSPNNPCPITGACCYTIPGLTGTLCAVTTQANCIQTLHGIYMGNNVPCTPNPCKKCIKPALGMVAWWSLDEIAGGIAHDSIAGHHGAYKPSVAAGPNPSPGFVDGGLAFDGVMDFVQVPTSPALDFNCGAFSIDAWINPSSYGGGIVRKSNNLGKGYEFYVTTTGRLALGLGNGNVICAPHTSTGIVPLQAWTHVAVTVSGGPPSRTIRFYINGVLSGTTVENTCVCLGNSAPVLIGSSGNFSGFWNGTLDEIEMFRVVLTPAQVLQIFQAGNLGKCKTRIHLPWDFPFCLNQNQVTVPVTICNDSPLAQNYNVSFQPLNTCTIPGPTVFTPLFSNPVNVPANNCVTVQVKINRPVGMVAVNQVACYQVTATSISTGLSYFGQGSVQDRRDLCAVIGPCCLTDVGLPVGVSKTLQFFLTNTSPVQLSFPYMVKAMDGDDMSPSQYVRLNGLPPGTRYIGNLTMPPSSSEPVTLEMMYASHHELGFDDIVLSTDIDGDGTFEPLISIGAHSIVPRCEADIAPIPVGSGTVDIDDLVWVITHWGNCPAPCPPYCEGDVNHNCKVDIDDLVQVITSWGDCP